MINQKENDEKKKRKKKIRTKQHSALINHFPSFSSTSPLEMETQTACMILKNVLSFQFSLPFFFSFFLVMYA